MLFNSFQFAVFFAIVYFFYLLLTHKWQNRMLLVASYFFYGMWDWRFLSLIWISTVVDYYCGIYINNNKNLRRRKTFLTLSVSTNLSILGFFKYFNFFVASLEDLVGSFGLNLNPSLLNIVLPVGISFYTFQTMSYTIDIYYRKMRPTNRFFDFALFVAFFPQLVAGPIERAKHLLPQILEKRNITLSDLNEGFYLISWGLFLKIFVADNLAKIVDPVFSSQPPYNGVEVLLSVYAFAFQIFGDFAGYSNIARGLGKCMGFDIMINFNLPYFATNPRDFWNRWHISLSGWLRDYLYIPLGGNRKGIIKTYRNLFITMVLGGLWHGAAWTFVVWGIYHAVLLVGHRLLEIVLEKIPDIGHKTIPGSICFYLRVIVYFHFTCLGWLIFRANSISQIKDMIQSIFYNFAIPLDFLNQVQYLVFFIFAVLIVQTVQYYKSDLKFIVNSEASVRFSFYLILISLCLYVIIFGQFASIGGGSEFIYFQF